MSFSGLGQYLSKYIPSSCLNLDTEKKFCRRRVFSIENTFWGSSNKYSVLMEVVRKLLTTFGLLPKSEGYK